MEIVNIDAGAFAMMIERFDDFTRRVESLCGGQATNVCHSGSTTRTRA